MKIGVMKRPEDELCIDDHLLKKLFRALELGSADKTQNVVNLVSSGVAWTLLSHSFLPRLPQYWGGF